MHARAPVTRFAPSPTGDLHLGHAFAAWFARDRALRDGGRFLVRIEDLDTTRSRDHYIARNLDDLLWLGLAWDGPVVRQSERAALHRAALDRLMGLGVLYPCFCTRRQIRAEIAAAGGAPQQGVNETDAYPGTCRPRVAWNGPAAASGDGRPAALRLHAERALELTGDLKWMDEARGPQTVTRGTCADVVIARKDVAMSYHLAVVVDDAAQGVTHVTRADDLFHVTHIHRLLYALLALPAPVWRHHRLLRDSDGRRLAKRDGAPTLRSLRDAGLTSTEVLALARG